MCCVRVNSKAYFTLDAFVPCVVSAAVRKFYVRKGSFTHAGKMTTMSTRPLLENCMVEEEPPFSACVSSLRGFVTAALQTLFAPPPIKQKTPPIPL